MPWYAIVRTAKIKSSVPAKRQNFNGTPPQAVGDVADHELRLKAVPNANLTKWALNRLLIGGKDLSFPVAKDDGYMRRELVAERISSLLKAKDIDLKNVRSNAVLAHTVLLTASPTFFQRRKKNSKGSGLEGEAILDEKYSAWRSASLDFVRDKYPGMVAMIVEHLDELTPHLVAIVVPLIRKEVLRPGPGSRETKEPKLVWRLAASDLFARDKLAELWTDYAKATAHLGLQRPPERVRAPYTSVHRHYAALGRSEQSIAEMQKNLEYKLPDLEGNILESRTQYKKRVEVDLQGWLENLRQTMADLVFQAQAATEARRLAAKFREELAKEQKDRRSLQAALDLANRDLLQARMNLVDVSCTEIFAALKLPHYPESGGIGAKLPDGGRVVFIGYDFTLVRPGSHPIKGTGSVEFLQALFNITLQFAEQACIVLLGAVGFKAIAANLLRLVNGRAPDHARIEIIRRELHGPAPLALGWEKKPAPEVLPEPSASQASRNLRRPPSPDK